MKKGDRKGLLVEYSSGRLEFFHGDKKKKAAIINDLNQMGEAIKGYKETIITREIAEKLQQQMGVRFTPIPKHTFNEKKETKNV